MCVLEHMCVHVCAPGEVLLAASEIVGTALPLGLKLLHAALHLLLLGLDSGFNLICISANADESKILLHMGYPFLLVFHEKMLTLSTHIYTHIHIHNTQTHA